MDAKTWAAAIMSILVLITDWLGWTHIVSFVTEEWIIAILAVLTPIFVWLTGNPAVRSVR